jgi:hypothetical protein
MPFREANYVIYENSQSIISKDTVGNAQIVLLTFVEDLSWPQVKGLRDDAYRLSQSPLIALLHLASIPTAFSAIELEGDSSLQEKCIAMQS